MGVFFGNHEIIIALEIKIFFASYPHEKETDLSPLPKLFSDYAPDVAHGISFWIAYWVDTIWILNNVKVDSEHLKREMLQYI